MCGPDMPEASLKSRITHICLVLFSNGPETSDPEHTFVIIFPDQVEQPDCLLRERGVGGVSSKETQ